MLAVVEVEPVIVLKATVCWVSIVWNDSDSWDPTHLLAALPARPAPAWLAGWPGYAGYAGQAGQQIKTG